MSVISFFYSIFSFFTFRNQRPYVLELSPEQQDYYDELLTNYESAFGEQVIGFRTESERLSELLCYWAAKGSSGLLVVAGDKVAVKAKMIATTKKIWVSMHRPAELNSRTVYMDRYTSESDLSMFSNRLIKSGILHLKNVNPNATFLQPVFEKLNTLVKENKLLCIIELIPKEIKVKSKLCGIPVPDWLCLNKPDTEQIENKIQEKWVEQARQHNLNTRLTDEELLKAIGCISQDCTMEKLEDVMLFLTNMRQKQEPAEKKRRVEEPSSVAAPSVTISNCGNETSTSTDSNNGSNNSDSNNSTSDSQNISGTIGDNNGNQSYVPPSRTVSVGNIEQDFLQKLSPDYLPLRAQGFAIPSEYKKGKKTSSPPSSSSTSYTQSIQNVLNMVSRVPPETADMIPHAPSRAIVKSALQLASQASSDKKDKDKPDKDKDKKRKRDTEEP